MPSLLILLFEHMTAFIAPLGQKAPLFLGETPHRDIDFLFWLFDHVR